MRIVCSSIGRCGSTLLFGAICEAFPGQPNSFSRHPAYFPSDGVLKTHCWAPDKLDPATKYVFIYGDPVMSAISVHQRSADFLKLHYQNMGANPDLMHLWPTEDVLHMQQNFRSWRAHFGEPNVFHLQYEDLFNEGKMAELGKFLEKPMGAFKREPRTTEFDPTNPDHIAADKTYTGIFD